MANDLALKWLIVAVLPSLYLACKRTGSEKTNAAMEPACDTTTLARAFASDTTRLTRRQRDASSGGAAEGFTAIGLYDSSGARRLLTVIYLGETGQIRYTFAFVRPKDYALRTVEEHYKSPMSSTVASRSETIRYFCNGRELPHGATEHDSVDAEGILAEADSLLAHPR